MSEEKPGNFLFVLTDGGGTVPPELGVARRLVERGHRVQVLAEASIAAQVRAAGAVMLDRTLFSAAGSQAPGRADRDAAQPSHTAYRDWEMRSPLALARGMADHMIAGPARSVAQVTAAQIRDDRPDRVVASFVAFGAMIAAEAVAVDFDVLIPNKRQVRGSLLTVVSRSGPRLPARGRWCSSRSPRPTRGSAMSCRT